MLDINCGGLRTRRHWWDLEVDLRYHRYGNAGLLRRSLATTLGKTLRGLVGLAESRGIFVLGVELCMAHLGFSSHFPERSTLLLGEVVPEASCNTRNVAVISFDIFEVVLVPQPGAENHEGIWGTRDMTLPAVPGMRRTRGKWEVCGDSRRG